RGGLCGGGRRRGLLELLRLGLVRGGAYALDPVDLAARAADRKGRERLVRGRTAARRLGRPQPPEQRPPPARAVATHAERVVGAFADPALVRGTRDAQLADH